MTSRAIRILRAGAFVAALAICPEVAAQSYWFESYERVVDQIDAGDHHEALPALEKVMRDHPLPAAGVRAPGNRFIDYAPYHQKARIQTALGNLESAAHNLDVSEAFGENTFDRRIAEEAKKLRTEIGKHAPPATSQLRP